MNVRWPVERLAGPAGTLHGRAFGPEVVRRVALLDVTSSALVLGSTQPEEDVDVTALDASGVELVRRRSGGGAVLLVPGQSLWVDVELSRDDAHWDDDITRSSRWLGNAWVGALGELGVSGSAHTGALLQTEWSRRVCFAGLGPGEVSVGDRKLVGVSQRRTRHGARFQCLVHRRWDPAPLLDLLALGDAERAAAGGALANAGEGLDVDPEVVVDALARHLPDG